MRERAISFNANDVRSTLAGRKSQFRRLVKLREFQPSNTPGYDWTFRCKRLLWQDYRSADFLARHCPYGVPGDRLWVKETWSAPPRHYDLMSPRELPTSTPIRYAADGRVRGVSKRFVDEHGLIAIGRTRPSIFMPRWASRITLEVTGVRVERLRSISEDDAEAEGVPFNIPSHLCVDHRAEFREQWDVSNEKRAPWSSNPWVWVVAFKRVEASGA